VGVGADPDGQPVIALFAKPPVAGQSKTRLGRVIGHDLAARFARAFVVDSFNALNALDWARVLLSSTEVSGHPVAAEVWEQCEGDLGEKIEHTMRECLQRAPYAFAMGADSPGLPPHFMDAAREAAVTHDAVIGPTVDGGFYLLGLNRCPEGLLANLPWSSGNTASATVARLAERGYAVAMLEPWWDVDEASDLDRLRDHLREHPKLAPETAAVLAMVC